MSAENGAHRDRPAVDMRRLVVEYRTRKATVRALDAADIVIDPGEIVGVVGESGSGKSTLGLVLGALLPRNARVTDGDLRIDGRSLLDRPAAELREYRITRFGWVPQSPLASLDPTMKIGRQLEVVFERHGIVAAPDHDAVRHHLERAGLDEPDRVARAYPHQLSGGMAQRAAIAVMLAHDPAVIVADEPTASLDSTVRDVVATMLVGRVRATRATMLLLSHDLHSIRRYCDRVVVMYGGRVVEDGSVARVLDAPEHPYTVALLDAAPGRESAGERLAAIDGRPPVLAGPSPGCAFAPRCARADESCCSTRPRVQSLGGHAVLCHHVRLEPRAEEMPT